VPKDGAEKVEELQNGSHGGQSAVTSVSKRSRTRRFSVMTLGSAAIVGRLSQARANDAINVTLRLAGPFLLFIGSILLLNFNMKVEGGRARGEPTVDVDVWPRPLSAC
jgi:hypothetical protein